MMKNLLNHIFLNQNDNQCCFSFGGGCELISECVYLTGQKLCPLLLCALKQVKNTKDHVFSFCFMRQQRRERTGGELYP